MDIQQKMKLKSFRKRIVIFSLLYKNSYRTSLCIIICTSVCLLPYVIFNIKDESLIIIYYLKYTSHLFNVLACVRREKANP